MKSPRNTRQIRINPSFIATLSRTLALATLGAMGFSTAMAADFNWDPNGTNSAADGGLGTWDVLNASWFDGAADQIWANLNTDKAIFGNTGGIVTINTGGTGVIANALSFTSTGYTLNSFSGAELLTLDGAAPSIAVGNSGDTATINAIIAGTVGFGKSGSGTLVLNGANTVTGGISVNNGTLRFNAVNSLGANNVTVGTGALLETTLNAPTLTNGIILNGGTYRYAGTGTNAITALKAINLTGDGTINLVNTGTNGKLLLGTAQLLSSAATTLTKTGNGMLQLSGANTGFQSSVVMNGGLIEFQHVDALGTAAQSVTVNSGAEFVASNVGVRHNFTANTGATLSANGSGGGEAEFLLDF